MKVYIGPYRNWIGPYQIADMLFFWLEKYPSDELEQRWDYKLHDRFGDWLSKTWVNTFCNWIDKKKKRKVEIKLHNYDTWSVDHTLALIIFPVLKQLKEHHHGSPWVNDEDVPEELKSTSAPPLTQEQKDCGSTDDLFHKRWEWVLDEMIWTFEQLADEEGDLKFYMEDYPDEEVVRAWRDRKKNGLRLFGKYYEALWD